MPYNTRRKSLSLPSLGIHLPVNRSASSNSNNSSNMASPRRPSSAENSPHPNKKAKRSHLSASPAVTSLSSSKPDTAFTKCDQTPPHSPGLQFSIEMEESSNIPEIKKVDLEGINDEVVEAVIVRLQESRNRPHLVKELANVLMGQVKIVQQSANPCAIISSRLASYLKRSSWSALAPCPLAKELETVHPRRTYFYLTTCPHQSLPDPITAARSAIITPSLSSSSSTSEDADCDRRRESLSPEVDLSSPEFDDMEEDFPMPGTPMGSLSTRHRSLHPTTRGHRGEEPPLEKDEKEFTQTADGLQKRKASGELLSASPIDQVVIDDGMSNEQLFGEPHRATFAPSLLPHIAYISSPTMRPSLMMPMKKDGEAESWSKLDAMLDWDKSPETVELDELDGLLDEF